MEYFDGLIFAVNGCMKKIPAKEVDANMKLSTYLRDELGLRGTKVGCGEGGCGACSILLSRYDATMKRVVTISANACLRPLVTIHGFNVTTVEGIGGPNHKNGCHAIQKKMADMSASQCGFCTPGFVVAIYSQLAKKPESTMLDMEGGLDGNLCRCTGYRPIQDAAKSFAIDNVESAQNSEGGNVQAELDAQFPEELRGAVPRCGSEFSAAAGVDSVGNTAFRYLRADTLTQAELFYENNRKTAKFSCSQTSCAIYKNHLPASECLIDVSGIAELRDVTVNSSNIVIGGATPIATFAGLLLQHSAERSESTRQAFTAVSNILQRLANHHIRNVASVAGNLTMCKELGFASDLATPLCALGAKVNIVRFLPEGGRCIHTTVDLLQHLSEPSPAGSTSLLVSVVLPFLPDTTVVHCYRTAIRCVNGHAITNAAFRAQVKQDGRLSEVECVYGAVGEFDVPGRNHPRRNEDAVISLQNQVLSKQLVRDVEHNFMAGDFVEGAYKRGHRQRLVKAYLLQFLNDVRATLKGSETSSNASLHRDVHQATQKYNVIAEGENETAPLGDAVPRPDGIHHATGTATYISDIKETKDTLFAGYVLSRCAKGSIKNIPVEEALRLHNVVRVVTAKDLQETSWCNNKVYNIANMFGAPPELAPDYDIISSGEITHCGQVVAIVLAKSTADANFAAKQLSLRVEYNKSEAPAAVTINQAIDAKHELIGTREITTGDINAARGNHNLQHSLGNISMGSQKHFYMETHSAYAVPHDYKMDVFVPMQGPTYMARAISMALGAPMSEVNVEHYRTGGSFGAKVFADHGVIAGVLAKLTGRPVKIHLDRNTDMQFQGGREETQVTAVVDFDPKDLKIHGFTMNAIKNVGVRMDGSTFPVGVSLPGNVLTVYDIANKDIKSSGIRTNSISRTATRAPGETEASYVGESVIDLVAHDADVHSTKVREANFKKSEEGDIFTIPEMWKTLMDKEGWRQRVEDSIQFNNESTAVKKGVSITPFEYQVNVQWAHVMVVVQLDGSVVIHHPGSEIGQGLNIKVIQAVCYELSKLLPKGVTLPINLFRSAGNQTHVLPAQGVTGGSTASEGNCMAAINAAAKLVERLKAVQDGMTEEADKNNWEKIVAAAFAKHLDMTANGFFNGQEPGEGKEKNTYKCYAVGAAEITLDVMTGQVKVDRFDIKYDAARSLNPAVDIGQVEGAFMYGLGYMLLEDAYQNPTTGWLDHDGTWDYKIPCAFDVPQEFNVELIHNPKFERGIMSSKASGEPPICVSPALTSAIRQCIYSARKDANLGGFPEFPVPFTPDRIAMACGTFKQHEE